MWGVQHQTRSSIRGLDILRLSLGSFVCFFFSSRRRHTRFDCDWSSDVCSSDLIYRHRNGAYFGSTKKRSDEFRGIGKHDENAVAARDPQFKKSISDAVCKLCEFRSEEHTSELQSQSNLVCRLLLETKKIKTH